MYLLADLVISTEAAAALGLIIGGLAGAVTWGVKGWINALTADRDSWMHIALANTDDLERVANKIRKAKGEPPIKTMAAVIAESSSPPTPQQKVTASIATVRARQARLRMDLGLPAQQEDNGKLAEEIAGKMKEKVDESAKEITQQVADSAEEIKDKIDDIGKQ